MLIRPSADTDTAAITRIYAYYVENTTATFEIRAPDREEIASRRQAILSRRLPFLVAVLEGVVVGYAYATPYRPRAAYRFTVEDSIYLDPGFTGRGIGRPLLEAVIGECERQGYRQMVAVIGGSDNHASIGLHTTLGFTHAGLLANAGYKFERWVDSVLMQRQLGAGATSRPIEIADI